MQTEEEKKDKKNKKNQQYYVDHREERRAYAKRWYLNNKDYFKKNPEEKARRNKQYYINNKEDIKIYGEQWRLNHPDYFKKNPKKKSRNKQYYINNKEDLIKYQLQWHISNPNYYKQRFLKNPDKVRQLRRKNVEKYCSTPQGKIRTRMSTLMSSRLKKRSSKKEDSMLKILPYTMDELVIHLENLFLSGMNWENYGQWHVDHKKPDALFNYNSIYDKEFQECWAIKNLQPLWAVDNLKKGKKYEEDGVIL